MSSNAKGFSGAAKKSDSNKKTSNEANSKFPVTRASDPPGSEPVLLERDLRLGRATWNKYVLPTPDFGTVVFKDLFQTYPDYETKFMDHIKRPSVDMYVSKKYYGPNFFNSPKFDNHMNSRVTGKLKDLFEALDKKEELTVLMTKLGLYHAKMGVEGRDLQNFQHTVVNAVRTVMNNNNKQMQFDEEEALNKCLSYAFHIAIKAGDEYLENQRQIEALERQRQEELLAFSADRPTKSVRQSVSKKNVSS